MAGLTAAAPLRGSAFQGSKVAVRSSSNSSRHAPRRMVVQARSLEAGAGACKTRIGVTRNDAVRGARAGWLVAPLAGGGAEAVP